MLPVASLDNENYDEIFEKARKMIPGLYPEWTDYNEHDPGITFLQLLSWMKEMQQFHLDQIGTEHLKVYLKLLGTQQQRKLPARALVAVEDFEESFFLPRGTRLLAGEIPFETVREEIAEKVEVTECVCISGDEKKHIGSDILRLDGKMLSYPFGQEPKAGNSFLIKLDRALKAGKRHSFYFDIFDDYPVERNPIDEGFYPLAELSVEYYGKSGFTPCVNVMDNTHGFLHSGILEYHIPDIMEPMEDQTYGIRVRLIRCEYDLPPILQSVSVNVLPVSQQFTLADYEDVTLSVGEDGSCEWSSGLRLLAEGRLEVYQRTEQGFLRLEETHVSKEMKEGRLHLRIFPNGETEPDRVSFRVAGYDADVFPVREYEMTGFPYQTIDLNDSELLHDKFAILVENPGSSGLWEEGEMVDSFHCSGPADRHFCLDEENGIVSFGNCEQGAAPEGRLRIIRYTQSSGIRGNVRSGQIHTFENSKIHASVENRENVSGGRDKESIEACFERFQREFRKVSRAVTAADYEELVLHTPGLRIRQVKAVPVELMKRSDGSFVDNCVSIVVQPFSYQAQAKLSAAYMDNIIRLLDKRRLIGTKVQVLSPDYIGATVYVDLMVKPHYPTAQSMVEETVKRYFQNTISSFGAVLEESALYGLLDATECVTKIRNLAIHAQGRGVRRTAGGSIKLPVNGLVYLKQADYVISAGDA